MSEFPSYAPTPVPVYPVPIMQPPFVVNPSVWRSEHFFTARGAYKIFGQAGYCFYYSASPPGDSDSEDDFDTVLAHESSGTYTDGIVYVAVKKTNGIVKSPFLPIGINGERYFRFDLSSGSELSQPPRPPFDLSLVISTGGVIIVNGGYFEIGTNRGEQFAIIYTINGSDPGTDSADIEVNIPATGPGILNKPIPAQADGVTVKVRVQVRRDDNPGGGPDYRYSDTDDNDIMTAIADDQGPGVPLDIEPVAGAAGEGG